MVDSRWFLFLVVGRLPLPLRQFAILRSLFLVYKLLPRPAPFATAIEEQVGVGVGLGRFPAL